MMRFANRHISAIAGRRVRYDKSGFDVNGNAY